MKKFKVGDFVEVPFKKHYTNSLVEFKADLPSLTRKAIGIVICTVPQGYYDVLLGFPRKTAVDNWTNIFGFYFRDNKIPNHIKYQYEFWYTNTNHLTLVEKQYEI